MAGRQLPGIGLTGFWELGEDNYKDAMDLNLLSLSVLVQCRVLSIVSATPGAPADGDIHFFDGDHPDHANNIAIRDDGDWFYIAAFEGLQLYDVATSTRYVFDGADLVEITGEGGGGGSFPHEVMDQATYDALDPPDPDTFYFITEA